MFVAETIISTTLSVTSQSTNPFLTSPVVTTTNNPRSFSLALKNTTTSSHSIASDSRASNSSTELINQIARLPGYDPRKTRLARTYASKTPDSDGDEGAKSVAAEVSLPWRRKEPSRPSMQSFGYYYHK